MFKSGARMVSRSLVRSPVKTISKVFSRQAWATLLRGATVHGIDRGTWDGDEITQRRYATYDDYLTHQKSKYAVIGAHLRENETIAHKKFKARFEACRELADCKTVVCLGARLGTEVRVLIELGHFAVGIDLEPGPSNEHVLHGDFHNLIFADASVDAVYTNCLDHIFDLDRFLAEVTRVLVPRGVLVADYQVGDAPDGYSSLNWESEAALLAEIAARGFAVQRTAPLGEHGSPGWAQAVMTKG